MIEPDGGRVDTLSSVYPFPRGRCPLEPPGEFAWLRVNAPVSRITLRDGSQGWLVTRYEDVRTVLSDPRFSRREVREDAVRQQRPATGGAFDFGLSIADPATHLRWRRKVGNVFNVRQAESMRPRIRGLVDAALDDLGAMPRPVDLMAAFAYRVPIEVIGELFDVPADLRPAFRDWASVARQTGTSMAAFGQAMSSLYESATQLVTRLRASPGDGPLSALATDSGADDKGLSDQELVSTVLLMTIAGYATAAAQFGNGMMTLFRHPDQLAALRRGETSIGAAVEEILRFAQASTGFAGTTYPTADVELGGVTIPAGDAVYISIDSAGRDETRIADPDAFDLRRGSSNSHLAFGHGPHFCLGAPLARVELQEGLDRLLCRYPTLRPATDVEAIEFASNLFTYYPHELPVTW